ncbi:flagellar biosynthesis protein FlhA [Burkholderia ubonensis]|uniref:flagellar biosynthesis protein FlhA n=1 Tax=Burkholderia ubonensis TaxID=101571 RepID=UPI0007526B52|nr:flagellar biosynthesis protein FlhA [Burkholderia ubonensis]KVO87656.1 flagellar biosynthesis protein FlhA [Burkholderia ubonensis]KVZ57273.1 flagellar biosynthesis protein FlhA [Burkholderia ubonensis]KVZ72971.1 flagellar biosynthesis protein FlhA [Burkholderia ubonensis]
MNGFASFTGQLKHMKLAVPIALMTLLAMVILPLPPLVLDGLFTFNLVLSILVIIAAVTVKRPLDFSAFPTIILASTLMRLTLNVASTRVVLLHGHTGSDAAGQVIESFANVAIGGNFVVGLVVFVILMIINFVVVTKGAERISEVSARFTLDALPGKQMAIDADLNSGLITQDQAQRRRAEVTSEADFYGAMDGASKFVRGDAIAGILVLVINMVGGLVIGVVMHDLSAADAFRQYALLTIGDGLVAQIPALLLSAAAAVIVTRISDERDFEQQISQQLLASPSLLYSAAGLLAVLGMIPGMPTVVFLLFAAAMGYAGWRMSKRSPDSGARRATEELQAVEAALVAAKDAPFDWTGIPYVEPLAVTLGYKLVALADPAQGAPLIKRLQGTRRSRSEALGFLLPPINARDDLGLPPGSYAIVLNGTPVAQAQVQADKLMAIPSPTVYGDLDGVPGVDPAYDMPVIWIDPDRKAHALGLGYQVVDCATVITTHVAKVMNDTLPEMFSYDNVSALLERLSAIAPTLGDALGKSLTHGQLRKVFRALLADGVSLKDIETIGATLVDAAETTKDAQLLAAEVRCALRRQIVASINGRGTEIRGFSLTGELESLLLGMLSRAEQQAGARVPLDNFPIDPNVLAQLQSHMPRVCEQMKQSGAPPLLLVVPRIRPLLARYARLFSPGLHVLSYNEIPEAKEVNIVGALG